MKLQTEKKNTEVNFRKQPVYNKILATFLEKKSTKESFPLLRAFTT